MPGGAFDKRQAQLILEPADLLGQRRLGDVLVGRRPREAQLFGERNQVPQLPQIHKPEL